jgi:hypothetical protein
MAVTATLYNHTVNRFVNGLNAPGDSYIINLYSVFDFDATDTTKALAEGGATQLSTANGYTQNDKALGSVTLALVTTNDAAFDAADVSWTASSGAIGPARYALIYNDTDADDPPVVYIDLGENKTADDGTPFNITFNSSGIVLFSYT